MDMNVIWSFFGDKLWGGICGFVKRRLFAQDSMEHDRKIFRAMDEMLNERELRDYLAEVGAVHCYRAGFLSKAGEVCRFLEQTSNQYLDSSINKKAKLFMQKLNCCMNFLSLKFTPAAQGREIGDDNFRFIANEELEIDEFDKELSRCIEGVEICYDSYRRAVKQKLLV